MVPARAPSPLTLRLFGPLDVQQGGQPLPRLRSRKGQWLLALLVLRAGREVERDWLAALLWPDSAPTRAAQSLRMSLKDLRQALAPEAERLHSPTPRTLCLDLTGVEVDVLAFDAALARGDLAALEEAVGLYQGPLLEGCAEAWVVQERQVRDQGYLAALEQLSRAALAQGDRARAESYLRRAVAVDPLRESAQRSLMQVLAAGGSYAAAVQVYRELRLALHREISSEPDAETQALFQQLRVDERHRAARSPRSASGSASLMSSIAPAAGVGEAGGAPGPALPVQRNKLIGREAEVAALRALLQREEVGVVTLTGAPGSGKTRLALAVGAELLASFCDGVFFVALAPVNDPDLVLPTIARALGVSAAGDRSLEESLQHWLRERQLLLVLDNFEQVVAAGPQLSELMGAAPWLKLLITSRVVLRLREEYEFPVPPLAVPDLHQHLPAEALTRYPAVALFAQRAQHVRPDFRLSDANACAVAEICRRLDGLPLALELAAARIKLFAPEALLARLENRLQFLIGGAADLPARQRTLRSAIAWSCDLLSEAEKRLFQRLSTFVGGCSLEAIEAVCNPDRELEADTLEAVASLVDQSLVQQIADTGGEPRFTMLETLREFGLEWLAQSGGEETIRRRHAEYYLALAETAEAESWRGEDQIGWHQRLDREHDNLRAALAFALADPRTDRRGPELGLRLAGALGRFWLQRGHRIEGRRWLERALRVGHDQVASAGAKALLWAAELASCDGDWRRHADLIEQSMQLGRETEDRWLLSRALIESAYQALYSNETEKAPSLFEEALSLGRAMGDASVVAGALRGLGRLAQSRGEAARAAALFNDCLAHYRKVGAMTDEVMVLGFLGQLAASEGDYPRSRALCEEQWQIYERLGDWWGVISSLFFLSHLSLCQGDDALARTEAMEGIERSRELGDRLWVGRFLDRLGAAARLAGDYQVARADHEEALSIYEEVGHRSSIGWAHAYLAQIALAETDYGAARNQFIESLASFRKAAHWLGTAVCLEGLATLSIEEGQLVRAARFLGTAHRLRGSLAPMAADERIWHEQAVGVIRERLEEQAFAEAWAEGLATTLEQAIAYALEEVPAGCPTEA